MANQISEKDWKWLRSLQDTLIERYCEHTLSKVRRELTTSANTHNLDKYRAIYNILHEDDKLMSALFDDWRRSTAVEHIISLHQHQLFSDEEWLGFSEAITSLVRIYNHSQLVEPH